jgi:hypothetical protein
LISLAFFEANGGKRQNKTPGEIPGFYLKTMCNLAVTIALSNHQPMHQEL